MDIDQYAAMVRSEGEKPQILQVTIPPLMPVAYQNQLTHRGIDFMRGTDAYSCFSRAWVGDVPLELGGGWDLHVGDHVNAQGNVSKNRVVGPPAYSGINS